MNVTNRIILCLYATIQLNSMQMVIHSHFLKAWPLKSEGFARLDEIPWSPVVPTATTTTITTSPSTTTSEESISTRGSTSASTDTVLSSVESAEAAAARIALTLYHSYIL
jgi:hypothetical protein